MGRRTGRRRKCGAHAGRRAGPVGIGAVLGRAVSRDALGPNRRGELHTRRAQEKAMSCGGYVASARNAPIEQTGAPAGHASNSWPRGARRGGRQTGRGQRLVPPGDRAGAAARNDDDTTPAAQRNATQRRNVMPPSRVIPRGVTPSWQQQQQQQQPIEAQTGFPAPTRATDSWASLPHLPPSLPRRPRPEAATDQAGGSTRQRRSPPPPPPHVAKSTNEGLRLGPIRRFYFKAAAGGPRRRPDLTSADERSGGRTRKTRGTHLRQVHWDWVQSEVLDAPPRCRRALCISLGVSPCTGERGPFQRGVRRVPTYAVETRREPGNSLDVQRCAAALQAGSSRHLAAAGAAAPPPANGALARGSPDSPDARPNHTIIIEPARPPSHLRVRVALLPLLKLEPVRVCAPLEDCRPSHAALAKLHPAHPTQHHRSLHQTQHKTATTVTTSAMTGILNAIVRSIALLWTLLITALIGNVIASETHAATSANAAINFTMFVAALSWVVCLYGLAAAFFTALASAVILLPLDILGVLFTFINAIVLAAKLRAPNCGNIPGANLPSNWIGYGSNNDEKRCREIQASTAFMWFLWACFSVCLFFTIKDSRGGLGGGFRRSGRPSMSQVGV
ncbi:hypothetical protein PCL_05929 [Purpureocillium lilacinum]|uniref:MARVEL domain-containing protein n=1 Tax=Purpureocillium lilacinum TaxID=33203 RepID=A0A2U3EL83_PURLI|nr:hypothetical protein PCL_05929 [Purpureocillium lilacinum]